MTFEEKQKLKRLWTLTAAYYQRELLDPVLVMYVNDLSDLPFDKVAAAFDGLRSQKGRRTMPMPSDVRDFIAPQADTRDEATELAGKLLGAIARHGWTWPDGFSSALAGQFWETMVGAETRLTFSFEQAVLLELGPFGMPVIRLMGGWQALHEEWAAGSEHGVLRAQIRDVAQGLISKTTPAERAALAGPKQTNILPLKPKELKNVVPTLAPEGDPDGAA